MTVQQKNPSETLPSDVATSRKAARRSERLTLFFAIVILTPSMIGFGMKFYEFVHTFQSDSSGSFAIPPMINYLLASLGFLCMLLWATVNGMFFDLEAPKYAMLQQENRLDDQSAAEIRAKQKQS
ncbi:MAG: hypothetical protein O2931_13750 [Planctomycetota bacterium]|nr:hypothetical protein [Planctomycetota bacterium]MDA1179849.1 hypothetical protein [Planctomycetota bacterium]